MLTPVEKVSLVGEVARKLRTGIISGYFEPGSKLIEEMLSKQMNTSRGPIRAAFIELEHEGLIRREPSHSVIVVKFSVKDVEEIHALRLALETLALEYLCENPKTEDVEALENSEQSLLDSVRSGAPLEESVELDISFHETLVRLSGNNRLLSAWQRMRSQVGMLIFSRSFHNELSFSEGASRHDELIQGVRAHDSGNCTEILREHLESLLEWLLASYKMGSSAGGHS